ncbi:MAG: hypothetical protein KIT45_12515 [Fimbriimonadia bacterium]|nr:hypothetical protein [Fimbriimonadia bacterium]
MTVMIRARFDGKVFVPDEPVDIPVGASGVFLMSQEEQNPTTYRKSLDALQRLIRRGVKGANIPDEALRRENLYDDRGL